MTQKNSKFPHLGFINFQDTETGEEIFINTKDRKFKDYFQNFAEKRITAVSEDLKKLKIDLIDIQSDMPYINTLVKFFKKRARRIK